MGRGTGLLDKHFEKDATNYIDNFILNFDGTVSCVCAAVFT